jgi:hypothetical protein
MKRSTLAALVIAALLTGLGSALVRQGIWQLLFTVAFVAALGTLLVGGARLFGWGKDKLREHAWRHEEGRHHAFAAVPLQVHDDGRHVWLGGAGLLRVLGRTEPDDVLAARMPGQWKRDAKGQLQLRVDAVIDHLAHMPGRDDPRIQKFRRYLERDVLFPAQQRHQRARAR